LADSITVAVMVIFREKPVNVEELAGEVEAE